MLRAERLVLLLGLSLSVSVWAQGPDGGPPPGPPPDFGAGETQNARPPRPRMEDSKHALERLSKELKLTDDQKQKIQPILAAQEQQIRSLREKAADGDNAAPKDRRTQFREIRQHTWDQIRPTLNADQQKRLDAMIARSQERERRMEERRRNGADDGPSPDGQPPGGPSPGGPPPNR